MNKMYFLFIAVICLGRVADGASYFFQAGDAPFFNKKEFHFDGSEKWYGISSSEVTQISGIRITNSQTGERVPYVDRKQLESLESDFFSISEPYADSRLYVFSGIKQIKEGPFKKANIGKFKCGLYEKKEQKGSKDKAEAKCLEYILPIEFEGKNSKVISAESKADNSYSELLYEKSGKKVSLGRYIGGSVSFAADFNHDGNVDFVIIDNVEESGPGHQYTIMISDKEKWEKVYSGSVGGL